MCLALIWVLITVNNQLGSFLLTLKGPDKKQVSKISKISSAGDKCYKENRENNDESSWFCFSLGAQVPLN